MTAREAPQASGSASLAPEHNRSKLTTTRRGGQRLSAVQAPWFNLLPPRGFGVLTTTGRKSKQPRQTCVRAIRDGDTVVLVAIAGERAGWLRNLRVDPRAQLRIRGGTFKGIARDLREDERDRAEALYCQFTGAFELLESVAHLHGWPDRGKISRMHRHWFRSGTPIAIDLARAA